MPKKKKKELGIGAELNDGLEVMDDESEALPAKKIPAAPADSDDDLLEDLSEDDEADLLMDEGDDDEEDGY